MLKAEPQYRQSQSAARQGRGIAPGGPQGERIAQLEAAMDSSPQAEKLGALSAMMNASPAMIAQRKKMQNLFGGAAQLKGVEDEPLQGKFDAIQRVEEEEPLQGKFETVQRVEEEEPLQGKFDPVQRVEEEEPIQHKLAADSPAQLEQQPASKPNHTGLPDNLKSGIENLSGMSMDSVRVHYNSSQPAQLNALAYAQGTDIHVAPGQERHLPHEAWHVVQQAQGRVQPTMQMKEGIPVNDDQSLEHEADVMGGRALQMTGGLNVSPISIAVPIPSLPVQRVISEDTAVGAQIKIYIEDSKEVQTVYYAGVDKKGDIKYAAKAGDAKKNKNTSTMAHKFAFDPSISDKDIRRTAARHQKEEEEAGDLDSVLPDTVWEFLKAELKKYVSEEEFGDLDVTKPRLLLACNKMNIDVSDSEFETTYKDDFYFEELTGELQGTEVSSSTVSSSSSSSSSVKKSWMHKKIKDQKGPLLESVGGSDGVLAGGSSLHHKLSRSRIKKMLGLLERSSDEGAQTMRTTLTKIQSTVVGIGDLQTALNNWAPNLELGPLVDKRKEGDDPGAGFDGNVQDGSYTPRSKELSEVDKAISNPKSINWKELSEKLEKVLLLQSNNQLSTPRLGQWQETEDGIRRDKTEDAGTGDVEAELSDDD